MKLLRLGLKNFKGIKNLDIKPHGESISIFGANATGKTSIGDALSWLLFDKSTDGKSPAEFGIKTLEDGEPIPNIDHEVYGEFDTITLRKIYRENWVTKRGNAEAVLDGHTTEYFVNEIPVKKGEYVERISEIMTEQQFKMLTLPDYFADALPWKERRTVLFDLCPITDQDVIDSDSRLARYNTILNGASADDREAVLKASKKKLNDELDTLPVRIDEATLQLTEVDTTGVQESIEQKKKVLEGIAQQMREASVCAVADIRMRIQELNAEKLALSNKHRKLCDESLEEMRDKIQAHRADVHRYKTEYQTITHRYQDIRTQVEQTERSIRLSEGEIGQARQAQPKEQELGVCSSCGQELKNADADYSNYVEQFNADKASRIKSLNDVLAAANTKLADLEKQGSELHNSGVQIKASINQREAHIEKAQLELQNKEFNQKKVEDTDAYKDLSSKIEILNHKLSRESELVEEQLLSFKAKYKEVEQEIEPLQDILNQQQANIRIDSRLAELKQRQKTVGAELSKVEDALFTLNLFREIQADLLTEKVNQRFLHTTWQLFRRQINGGLEPVCEAVYKGVPYSSGLNNAGRIATGIDIIETLSAHYDKSAPITVDNAEAITDIPQTNQQIIALYVSASDPVLRVETQLQTAEL